MKRYDVLSYFVVFSGVILILFSLAGCLALYLLYYILRLTIKLEVIMTMISKYSGTCRDCGEKINKGDRINWSRATGAVHENCESGSMVIRFSSGAEIYRNRKGRCEDAPCCGCCS